MSTTVLQIEEMVRQRINEPQPKFWSSDEMQNIIWNGVKDLWRDIVDLKQEHFLTVDATNVSLAANTATLTGVPADVHKVYLIEARDTTSNSTNVGLVFKPLDYNHDLFQQARGREAIDPSNDTIYYCIVGAGSPVSAPTIYIAPQVNAAVNIRFVYVPTLATLGPASTIPIPGEADNALVAWGVAFARSKEREDRSPDPNWLSIYATEKQHLLQSLGARQYQEPQYTDAIFSSYW